MNNFWQKLKQYRQTPQKAFWPSKKQWSQFFNVINRQEKSLLAGFLALFFVGLGLLGTQFYLKHSEVKPSNGGVYTEAFIGKPRFINPVLAQLQDADRDISSLIFSGLMKYDDQGQLVPDLAESFAVGDFGKIYDVTLKNGLKWHDGKSLNVNDVIFTLQIIQNPEYKSPLRLNWQSIEFEKINERTVRFKLKNAYSPFPHNFVFGILPQHLWKDITASGFSLSELNLKPVGSGPYQFNKLQKDKDGNVKRMELKAFADYYSDKPYISTIILQFFPSEEAAMAAYQKGLVDGLNFLSPQTAKDIENQNPQLVLYPLHLPRYFAIFFNQTQNPTLTEKPVRQALAYAIDKKELIDKVLAGHGQEINSPFLSGMTGHTDQLKTYEFSAGQAKDLLTANGWQDSNNDGILEKNNHDLEITLTTAAWPELEQTAGLIKSQWEKIGAKVNLEIKELNRIQNETIRTRQYQILLFGQILSVEPDPFFFWHSSQKRDPGLNLSLYESRQADQLLEEARRSLDNNERAQKYQKFSAWLAEDLPAIFLFSIDYLFAADKKVKGIKFEGINLPFSRFGQVNLWYLKTARSWRWR